MKLSKFAQQLTSLGYEIIFTPINETTRIEGSFGDSGTEKMIRDDYEAGNLAAWFMAEVKVGYKSLFSNPEYLGGCSYIEFDDFTEEDNGYFDDMLRTCLNDLEKQLNQYKTIELPKLI